MPILDGETIDTLFHRYLRKIYKYFYYRTLVRELAEDLTSSTFLKFVETANKSNISDSKAYLFGIASHVWNDYLRRKYTQLELPLNDAVVAEEIDDESRYELHKREAHLHALIEQLPEKQRDILRLRLVEKKSLGEICAELGKDMNYVKTTQKRAIKKLKALLECTPLAT